MFDENEWNGRLTQFLATAVGQDLGRSVASDGEMHPHILDP